MNRKQKPVLIIGGGLAGAEAGWRLARMQVPARLYEMRPRRMTPAHKTGLLAELVCSNSLKSDSLENASGLLKAEMDLLGSLVMEAARKHRVPAGSALAVDRERFAKEITERLEALPALELIREEVKKLPDSGLLIIASGPLTSEPLAKAIQELTGEQSLFFYDAIAPLVFAESIDMSKAFFASRYGKGGEDYINCPLTRQEYDRFVEALLSARLTPLHEFEEPRYFEGCLPIEVMAQRGRETLAYGPMKPVGLIDPRTGKRPYAVVQLRRDDKEGRLFSMVGFQTRLARPEQERVFRMIPGLEKAEFARFGSIHRNTFINSPALLAEDLSLRKDPRIFFAGQITGVEGYLESAATGIIAGLNAARRFRGRPGLCPPAETITGALIRYITDPERKDFQPMNANFGILPPLPEKAPKKLRKRLLAERAIEKMREFVSMIEQDFPGGETPAETANRKDRTGSGQAEAPE